MLASLAQKWFRRFRRVDDLSRLVREATGSSVKVTQAEFDAVRRLLEDQETWRLVGRGTIEDLGIRIAACLPPRDGRTAEDSHAAAMTIARGLLEFAVADLDPKLFQQVLLTRLDRMEANQASALDEALLGLHADLVAGLAAMGELDARRFTDVMRHLRRVLDRLPPGPADRGAIVAYLQALADWLNTDPWPRDQRFNGPALTPTAMERELYVVAGPRQYFGADDLAQRCRRLVILGRPGSGKTWLAKRTARRCADKALEALAAGESLDELELPLYTTCSRLFAAGGDIRQATVSSALDQLGDLGGSRLSGALRVFFAERNTPTLLVIDSLDEAHGDDDRLRQVDTLPWRIVLTSRPKSWNGQLVIKETDDSRTVGVLLPLSYPHDVQVFIERWFAHRPEQGKDLAAQIARRPGLQAAATVPLILAFYCIVGGEGPLPELRRDLYVRVLKRVLTGRWRGSGGHQPDVETCLQTLRAWAWSGAASHPVSGIGTWADDIPAEHVRLGAACDSALDHVATPLGPPDVDTGTTQRRFIHRSIREHLVAEHIASLSVEDAVEALLPHLWYDIDWEHSAPAAIAMHPHHNELLRDLMHRSANSDQIPADLSVIDAGWEWHGLLARVATESREAGWSPDLARIISQARVELARSGRTDDLVAAPWESSNRHALGATFGLLAGKITGPAAARLARGVMRLASTEEDRRQALDTMLGLLRVQTNGWTRTMTEEHGHRRTATELVGAAVQLSSTAEDKRRVLDTLLSLLASWAYSQMAEQLTDGVIQLGPTAEDRRRGLKALLGLLTSQAARGEYGSLVRCLVQLSSTSEDKYQTRERLLRLLPDLTDARMAEELLKGLVQLSLTAAENHQACTALLKLLDGQTDSRLIEALVKGVPQLSLTAPDRQEACETLLRYLADRHNRSATTGLVQGVVQLSRTAQDKRHARGILLRYLNDQTDSWQAIEITTGLLDLDPAAEDKRQARAALLSLLSPGDDYFAAKLADRLRFLDPTPEDKRQAREILLRQLAGETDTREAIFFARAVIFLNPTAEDERRAREILLTLLADQGSGGLVSWIIRLNPTPEDLHWARETLAGLLAELTRERPTDNEVVWNNRNAAESFVRGLIELSPAAEDKRRARETLAGLLAELTKDPSTDDEEVWARLSTAEPLVNGLTKLDPTPEDKQQARSALIWFLRCNIGEWSTERLMGTLAQLEPTASDLNSLFTGEVQATVELLAAVRKNTPLNTWLATLPSLIFPHNGPILR